MKVIRFLSAKGAAVYHFFGPILSVLFIFSILLSILIISFIVLLPSQCQSHNFVIPRLDSDQSMPAVILSPTPPPPAWYDLLQRNGQFISNVTTIFFLALFVISILYTLVGIVQYILSRLYEKKPASNSHAKLLFIRGIVGVILSFLLFFFFQYALGLFGICL